MNVEKWEKEMLSLPIARQVSGEDIEHQINDDEYTPNEIGKCRCQRCIIIRIKRRKAFRFPRSKCPKCGKLFTSIYTICDACRST